jgi:ubiquinone/menaquinone biosynthesis C-methylase UbiE
MSPEKIATTFDAWAESGRGEDMEHGHGDVVEQVLADLDVRAGEKILDLGCGTGWATRMLAKSAAGVQAIGIDVSPGMIARAESQHSFTIRARYEVAQFEELPFKDGEFTRAFSMEALYYAPDLDRSISELARVLGAGGVADVVVDFYAEAPGTEEWPVLAGVAMHRLSEDEWRERFLAAGFETVELSRVVDRRGPGDEAAFEPSKWTGSWSAKVARHEAGSLRIRATKPA